MSDKKFCDMDEEERFEDLLERTNAFQMLQLPGQPQGMHMGTAYLINDLWRTVSALKKQLEEVA